MVKWLNVDGEGNQGRGTAVVAHGLVEHVLQQHMV